MTKNLLYSYYLGLCYLIFAWLACFISSRRNSPPRPRQALSRGSDTGSVELMRLSSTDVCSDIWSSSPAQWSPLIAILFCVLLSIYLSIYPSIYLSIYLSTYLSINLSIDPIQLLFCFLFCYIYTYFNISNCAEMALETVEIDGVAVPHRIIKITGDGACLFSSLSNLVHGTA